MDNLLNWSEKFIKKLKENLQTLALLELLRGSNEVPISLARFHVQESINVVTSAMNFDLGLDLQHPDTRGGNYGVSNVLIEDSTSLLDIVRYVFSCLYSKCVVKLIVKSNCFYSAMMSSYLVDMIRSSGASPAEVDCLAFDRRDSLGNERFDKPFASNKSSKLSAVATVFRQTDTFAAAQSIIESYFRELYPNLIVLVEESAYERFVKDWQRYYSHVLQIGSRLDSQTTVVDFINCRTQVDLEAIDIKTSHKMTGNVVNVLKFRTLTELMQLLGSLRKVPYMSVWNDDVLLSREFCARLNQCNEFWINHIPRSIAGRKLTEDMLTLYGETVAEDMAYIYNSVYSQFSDEAEQLRKLSSTFMKKDSRLRTSLLIHAFVSIVTKSKSLKNGSTVGESVARLKKFQQGSLHTVGSLEAGDSRIETILRPVGLAILYVRDDTSLKNKATLLEFVFKNLLLGNAVLLVCPPNTLGARFSFENDHVIPFKMVNENLPDISRLSLNSSIEASDLSINRKYCPKNTYAIEVLPDMTSDTCEAITIALGSRRRSIWYSDVERANYWSNDFSSA